MRREYIAWFDMPNSGKLHGQSVMPKQELTRCKDCKWYYRGGATCMYWDGENNMHGDDYCSRAERREE